MAADRGSVPADFVEYLNKRHVPRSLITLALSLSNDIGLVIAGTMEVTDRSGSVQCVSLAGE